MTTERQKLANGLVYWPMTEGQVFDAAARGRLYAVLDAAGAPQVPDMMDRQGDNAWALYESRQNPHLRLAAPYLVKLNEDLMAWIRATLWNDPWGILVESGLLLEDVRRHLRRFLLVEDPNGKTLYFRFYDPRILAAYMTSSSDESLMEFFGPIEAFVARTNYLHEFLRYAFEAGQVQTTSSPYKQHVIRASVDEYKTGGGM